MVSFRSTSEDLVLGNWTDILTPDGTQDRMRNAKTTLAEIGLADPGVDTVCIWSSFTQPSTEIHYRYTSPDDMKNQEDPSP